MAPKAEKLAAKSWQTINRLWKSYLHLKGGALKGIVTDKNHYNLHLRRSVGEKISKELVLFYVDLLRLQLLKNRSVGTVRNVLELLSRIINFEEFRKIADDCEAKLLAEIAHFEGFGRGWGSSQPHSPCQSSHCDDLQKSVWSSWRVDPFQGN